jgi:hypothetical protein
MIHLSKKEVEELFNNSEHACNFFNGKLSIKLYRSIVDLECKIVRWCHHYVDDINKRREVIDLFKKKFGNDTYTFTGWVKYTNYGIRTSNDVKIMFSSSSRGTSWQIENNTPINKIFPALQELHDYLYDKNAWYKVEGE